MEIKQTKIEKSTVYLETTVSQKEIDELKEHAIDEMIGNITVKGFRQGKAPRAIAAEQVDPNKLTNHVLGHVFNDIVNKAVSDNKYRLLGRPVLNNIEPQKDGGWIIKLDLPLYPEVNLGDYKKLITSTKKSKTATKKDNIEPASKKNDEEDNQKLEAIYDVLLEKIKIEISPLLVEEEVNYSLERLGTQAKTLNLTLESYLKAVNKTIDEVKAEYSKKAEESIKLDIILLAISNEEKLDTSNEELLELAKVSNIPQEQLGQLKSVMNRRKTIDYLLKI